MFSLIVKLWPMEPTQREKIKLSETTPHVLIDNTKTIPLEIVSHILSFLDAQTVHLKTALVCKGFLAASRLPEHNRNVRISGRPENPLNISGWPIWTDRISNLEVDLDPVPEQLIYELSQLRSLKTLKVTATTMSQSDFEVIVDNNTNLEEFSMGENLTIEKWSYLTTVRANSLKKVAIKMSGNFDAEISAMDSIRCPLLSDMSIEFPGPGDWPDDPDFGWMRAVANIGNVSRLALSCKIPWPFVIFDERGAMDLSSILELNLDVHFCSDHTPVTFLQRFPKLTKLRTRMDLPIPSNLTKITAFLPDLEEIEVNDLITVLDWNLHFIQDLEDSLERFGQHRNLKKLTFFARDPHTPSLLVRTPLTEAIRGLMHVYPNLSDVRIVETYPLPSQALLDWIESMKKYRDQLKKYREDAKKAREKTKKIQADLKKPENPGTSVIATILDKSSVKWGFYFFFGIMGISLHRLKSIFVVPKK